MASSTVFSGVKVTWLGHASVMLEADGHIFYIDPFVLPRGAKLADVILYTHGHFDHAVAAPLITKSSTIAIAHRSCKLPVRLIDVGAKEKIGGVIVEAVDAYNTNKNFHPRGSGAGYLIHFKSATVYVAGDTDNIPEMKNYKCDIAIVPIGGTYTMDAKEASDAIVAISPKVAIPYHYGYLDGLRGDPEGFRMLVTQKTNGKTDVRLLEMAK